MINGANLKKTYYYLKKNGIVNTFYAVCERIHDRSAVSYCFTPISEKEREDQKHHQFDEKLTFSILVPMYETPKAFAQEMIQSVLSQTYGNFELILADASKSDSVKQVACSFFDDRIRYIRLEENRGISENTNQALQYATGDYIGLLDHDDLLTEDALYEMAKQIESGKQQGVQYAFLYSDEDKCDTEARRFYDPNFKLNFNYDLLLSNNYICHFLVMKTELMQQLMFRPEYDGAQDYDLVLRAVHAVMHAGENMHAGETVIGHISRVLYHWRCHEASTASNPQSKQYAYEAGRRAIQDFLQSEGIRVQVTDTKHNGFYRIEYCNADNNLDVDKKNHAKLQEQKEWGNLFTARPDVGILAGPVYDGNKITGGIYDKQGNCPYKGLNRHYSGYLHRAALQQNADIIDVRNMMINPLLAKQIEDILQKIYDNKTLNYDLMKINREISEQVRSLGYRILWDPLFQSNSIQRNKPEQGGQ